MANITRYITAVVGALLIFGGVFFICGLFVTPNLPEFFQSYVHIGAIGTNNPLGVLFGLVTAVSSFLATLRMKR